jgi:2-polyprenyl-6-methoxyphenol hydroxylase-like FAD-dependent oxidoreductase
MMPTPVPAAPNEHYDVAIPGGGLAGLSLALQLTRARPGTTILVVERRDGQAPEAAFKVGESTVELSAHYFSEVLGLRDHLKAHQLPKAGLRYFFLAGDNRDIAARVEFGGTALPPVPSYQLDRGRLLQNCRRHRTSMSDPERLSGHTAQPRDHPINDLVAAPLPGREYRDKAGHPRATKPHVRNHQGARTQPSQASCRRS